jgi:hypothetical protein
MNVLINMANAIMILISLISVLRDRTCRVSKFREQAFPPELALLLGNQRLAAVFAATANPANFP